MYKHVYIHVTFLKISSQLNVPYKITMKLIFENFRQCQKQWPSRLRVVIEIQLYNHFANNRSGSELTFENV